MDGTIPLPPPQASDEPMADAPTTHPYTIDNTDDNDSDWEYEYHPTETETHYVVLDISSSKPIGPYHGKRRPRNDDTLPQPPPPSPPPPSSSAQPQPTSPSTTVPPDPPDPPTATAPTLPLLPEIILENLHTPTPHLTHNNTLYRCSWSTPLGTDLLLTSPPASTSPSITRPASASPDIDILGLSRLRLTARPIKNLRPDQQEQEPTRSRPPTIGRPVVERRERQIGFLARLAEVKKVKGEADTVRIGGWRSGEDPRGRGRWGRGGGGRRVRRMGDVEEMGNEGEGREGRRVRWGDDVGVGLGEGRVLVGLEGEGEGEGEEEARLREVVGDEEILQGEEGGNEGEQGRDEALEDEEMGVGEIEGAEEAADMADDDDDEDVGMEEG